MRQLALSVLKEDAVFSAAIDFVTQQLPPNRNAIEKDTGFRQQLYPRLGDCGIMGMAGPKPYGSAFSAQQMAVIFEEIAKVSVGLAISLAAHSICVYMIGCWGDETQKKRWLPELCRGERIGTFSLTEPRAGSDAKALMTKAIRGQDGYTLRGCKTFVTNGSENTVNIVLARVSEPGHRKGSVSAFIVAGDELGMKVKPYVDKKVGFGSFPLAFIVFSACLVPEDHRLGSEGKGLSMAMKALEFAKINLAAIAVGLATDAYQAAVTYAKKRKQFDRRIADFQAIQFMLADMHMAIKTARLLVRYTAEQRDNYCHESHESALAKCYATDVAMQVVTDSSQILGGAGLLAYPLEKKLWEAKLLQIVEGTNQIQRMIVASAILK